LLLLLVVVVVIEVLIYRVEVYGREVSTRPVLGIFLRFGYLVGSTHPKSTPNSRGGGGGSGSVSSNMQRFTPPVDPSRLTL